MGVERVCLAAVAGAHGVRGLVKLKTFTEYPEDVASYGRLTDQKGQTHYDITLKGQVKGTLLAEIAGIADREAAQALRGTRLYVERSALPQPEDPEEFYHADLVNLSVETEAGEKLGRVKAVLNFGAGDLLEIDRKGDKPILLSFTQANVPVIDLDGAKVIVALPEEIEDGSQGQGKGGKQDKDKG